MPSSVALVVFALLSLPHDSLPSAATLIPNDNRRPAGRLHHGVLTVNLEARTGTWHPEGEAGPGLEIAAFGEAGGALQIPGPLIRARAGTEVRVSLRNSLDRPLLVRGLHDRPIAPIAEADSLELRPGETREIRFHVSTPGTYYYWGRTEGDRQGLSLTEDSQLLGALIVDPPSARAVDRVLVITMWIHPADTTLPLGRRREALAINGLSWPHTERLAYAVGDSVRWRVINGTVRPHPMHLHGFYFQVDSRGTATADTIYGPGERRLAVTEFMLPGTTMALRWSPTRPGNWLFHCHLIAHITPENRVQLVEHRAHDPGSSRNHALEGMAGLVIGIQVTGESRSTDASPPRLLRPRSLRLFAQQRGNHFGLAPGYGFVLQEGPTPPAPDSIRIPGTPIMLRRDEPVEITVVNRTDGFVTVHWHGIELDSYYDGVGDWSGGGPAGTAKPIAPGDSFLVRFTPRRAGTFIYHTHQDETQQLASGLYGPLVVLAPGAARDTATDLVFLVGRGGPGLQAPPFLNGSTTAAPLDWEIGTTYRLRFINITPSDRERVVLMADSTVQEWRAFAKDGADLPREQARVQPADLFLGAGETYDFEFTPTAARDLSLAVTVLSRGKAIGTIQVPIRVR